MSQPVTPRHQKSVQHLPRLAGFGLSLLLFSFACERPEAKKEPALEISSPAPEPLAASLPPIDKAQLDLLGPPLPKEFASATDPITEEKITLGRMLYFEKRLSKNHDISCASCHGLDTYGVDRKPFSDGHKGQKGGRNAPSTYLAAGHFVQFWDGRSPHVEHQATGPVTNPVEMSMKDEQQVAKVLRSIPEYVAAFKAAFPKEKEPVSLKNAGRAIGAFERRLVTPSRFDRFVAGDRSAISADEAHGFLTFVSVGCTACHNGTLLGGSSYQKTGAVKPWPNQKDQGRFEITQVESDRMMFKVPSLRNVAETAPYFHDASADTLEQAISRMAEHQLGKQLTAAELAQIKSFLVALTGEIPADYVKEPQLPASTDKTPKPDPN